MPDKTVINIQYAGATYAIELCRVELRLPDGSVVTHFEAVDARWKSSPLFVLGMRLFETRVQEVKRIRGIGPEVADEILAIAKAAGKLPAWGRRIDKQVLPPQDRTPAPTRLSAKADENAEDYASQYEEICRCHTRGEYSSFKGMTAGEFLRLVLEVDTVRFLRELASPSLITVDEREKQKLAREVLSNPSASAEAESNAHRQLSAIGTALDEHYAHYYQTRRKLMTSDVSDEEVRKKIDRLRKSKSHPERKGVVRLLKTENIDMARYRPYFQAMRLVQQELVARGELRDPPSRAFYEFMHHPSEVLSGIVPAVHAMYWLFLQSQFFRNALAVFAREKLGGDPRGKNLESVCALYGAILAIVEVYAVEALKLRGGDLARPRRPKTKRSESTRDYSFDEALGTEEVGGNARRRRGGVPDGEKNRSERDHRSLQCESKLFVSEEKVRRFFTESEAPKVMVYMRASGWGQPKTKVTELAREHNCDRKTIYRWGKEGEELLRERGPKEGSKRAIAPELPLQGGRAGPLAQEN